MSPHNVTQVHVESGKENLPQKVTQVYMESRKG
jgi:hypothetical protein